MTEQRKGGLKRSSWLTFRRRLILVRRLLVGPATSSELIEAVTLELRDQGYPGDAISALKHDLDSLKSEYNCQIRFQRRANKYYLSDLGELALLDMPDECMEALAFLDASFPPGTLVPEHANVRALLDRILMLLPPYRQREHRAHRGTITLQMSPGVPGAVNPKVFGVVKRAIERRQELAFDYRSNSPDMALVQHRVAPYAIFFSPEGHAYLDATPMEVTPPDTTPIKHAVYYRLDRMVEGSPRILSTMLPPERVRPHVYKLRYTLAPEVARRRDVATFFPETTINYQDDGSAIVTANVTNLWQARQILLRYGDACVVEEPEELVDMFHNTAEGLAEAYLGYQKPAPSRR